MSLRMSESAYALLKNRTTGLTEESKQAPGRATKSKKARSKKTKVSSLIRESDVLSAALALTAAHPAVAWASRMNTGMGVFGEGENERRVHFGFEGMSDIIGQMFDGRFLAIECKRPGKTPTQKQSDFLDKVERSGGVALWIDDVATLAARLKKEKDQF